MVVWGGKAWRAAGVSMTDVSVDDQPEEEL